MTTQHRHKRKDGLRRQAQIMSLAMRLFAEKGYHSTSVDDIITAAQIVKGTFYLHFKSKQDLLNSIVDTHLNLLYESLKILDISLPRPLDEIRQLYSDVGAQLMQDPELKVFVKLMLREVMGH
ncbi:MAG TPA: helix-turn-helix domain-containing protein, partial [Spirochaetota bacterium]|nr:helix-turn-helix domain-containing protein [Spirochaetota bacterium]